LTARYNSYLLAGWKLGASEFDELVKSPKTLFSVIPAEAGIREYQEVLDPGFRRGDHFGECLRTHQV
jgi:hypothetical protein